MRISAVSLEFHDKDNSYRLVVFDVREGGPYSVMDILDGKSGGSVESLFLLAWDCYRPTAVLAGGRLWYPQHPNDVSLMNLAITMMYASKEVLYPYDCWDMKDEFMPDLETMFPACFGRIGGNW